MENRAIRPIKSTTAILAMAAVASSALMYAPEARAADVPVYVYADVSPSVRATELQQVLKDLSLRLEQYEGPSTLVISVIPFYQDAYSAAPLLRVRISSAANPPCDGTPSETEIARLSKAYALSAKKDADAQCLAIRDHARSVARGQRDAEIAKLNSAIDHLGEIRIEGHCTAVNAMIRRAATETPTGISILISDLENDCPPYTLMVTSPPTNRVFVVPVGSHTRPVEEWFDIAKSRFGQRVPEIRLLESFNLDIIFQVIAGERP